ncbi:starch phosphorylase [Desulfohalotomaculum tongense]|uniref:alpha-glucan family phosphorylase n=1 Tax=Desulforadius tongensis TaxID=1216062 RepID=UPI001957047E|nr:alpha-glucan family phosphorylase [Desulforadius tongensis]MBM7856079.1 starch phosphorylase [Desulforadius tongensis]
MYYYKTVSVNPKIPQRIGRLQELAYNLWFSWNPEATDLFEMINPDLWEDVYHNPVKFLLNVNQSELDAAAGDSVYLEYYDRVFNNLDRYMDEEKWFQKHYPDHNGQVIAYFSAEFGLHESLPIYSGGLGLLAGDHTKAASDLGLPFVGVGLLYKHGYFTQRINSEGWQQAEYPGLNFSEMPIKPVSGENGREVIIPLEFPGRTVFVKVWKVNVGRAVIYLLDADIVLNSREDRMLTGQLYGGGNDMRISQEIILGIGGVKALRAMGITPFAWHINEGHAAFLCLERMRELVSQGVPLATAKEAVKSSTLFTTHTPVPAGHDIFDSGMVERYLQPLYNEIGMNRDDFMKLGRNEGSEGFNMTVLAMNLSGYTNGVSKLHGRVSRKMFHHVFKPIPLEEVPIDYITNGVHTKSWLAQDLADLFARYLGEDWYKNISNEQMWEQIENIPDDLLWEVHKKLKERTITYIRENLKEQRRSNKESIKQIMEVDNYLDPEALTIGFARRFATYKRATLLFRDKQRLARLLCNPERPVQIIFAGKAHPADQPGKELIKQIYDISSEEPFKGKIIFLENYDINMARHLVQGVDVWLNTPRWPMEASGTSGMKAGLNGVLNCSVLDGWWPEAYNGQNGFAVGEDKQYHSEEEQDRDDAYYLYAVLEEQVVPSYYERKNGLSPEWMMRMKSCLCTITWEFSTERMVKDYVQKFYVNCIKRGIEFQQNNYEIAAQIKGFKQFIQENWHHVTIQSVNTNGKDEMLVGDELQLEVQVKLGPIWYEDVSVEIVCGDEIDGTLQNIRTFPMEHVEQVSEGIHNFRGAVKPEQGTLGYTVRVRPNNPHFANKFEVPLVSWAPNF